MSRLYVVLLVSVLAQLTGSRANTYFGADRFWEYSRETFTWQPVSTESMQYRLSKVDQQLILTSRINSTNMECSSTWPNRNSMGLQTNSSRPEYGLSVLWSKSVFCLSEDGSVFERFWNEQIWVYVNHHSPLFAAASITAYAGRLYVSARDGNVFERRRVGQELKWINANVPTPHKVASPPRIDPDGALWFVSDGGHLLQCDRKITKSKVCQSWIDHKKPFGVCLAAVVDASTLHSNVVYTVSSDGQLLQYDATLQEWADLGRPIWAAIAPAEGISLVNEESGDQSLFMLSTAGTLAELRHRIGKQDNENAALATTGSSNENYADSELENWQWFDHGSPPADRITGPPGGLINMRSMFMVSENGTVYERYWDESKWIWVSHGHSGVPTLPARPVALDNRHIFFQRQDNLLTERFWNGIEWVWSIHRVPRIHAFEDAGQDKRNADVYGDDSESVSFCSPEIGVRESCAPPLFNT